MPKGFTLLELLFVMFMATVLAAIVTPVSLDAVDRSRTMAAARYLAARMTLARTLAVKRSSTVALRFDEDASGVITMQLFADGGRDGVRTRDIVSGEDPALAAPVRLSDLFPGVAIALADGSGPADPVRFGPGNIVSFTSSGTASSGSVYVRGREGTQLAVRVLGATGRTRLLRYGPRTGEWVALAW